jgi:hypothetical protein
MRIRAFPVPAAGAGAGMRGWRLPESGAGRVNMAFSLPVGGWPAIPALIGRLARPAIRGAGVGSPLLRRGGGRGGITHSRCGLVPGRAAGPG